MPNTPNKNLPYPDPSDIITIPLHIQELAEAVDVLPSLPSAWTTGDTKIIAQPATHADPQGGTWYLADGSAVPPANTALVAMLGANFPDARGGALVMKGTHSDVNAIGKKDPAAQADRRIAHKHTVVNPTVNSHAHGGGNHGHGVSKGQEWENEQGGLAQGLPSYGGSGVSNSGNIITAEAPGTSGGTVGPQAAGTPLDSPSFTVVGNLFYHS